MTKRWILRVGLAVFGLAILWAGQGARAGIAVAPLKQEVGLRPGETGKVTVTITNNRRNELDLTQSAGVMVMDVQVSENGALDFKEPGTAKDSAGKWVSIDQTSVTLDAGKSQIVECTVAVPVSTAPGEYYAALMITLANKGKTDKGLKIEYRIASGIFVNVLGQNYPKQGRVTRAELVWPETASTQPTTQPEPDTQPATRPAVTFPKLEVLMENTGKARFDGSGHVSIVDEHARTVFTAKLASARPCIFAGDSRIFETPLTKALPAGKYRVKVEMDYQSSWAKARYEIPVEILPASAELMAKLQLGGDGAPVVEVGPEKLTGSIPPGAMRSLALAIINKADSPVRCGAHIVEGGSASDAWITLPGDEFVLAKGGRKSMGIIIRVPKGTPAGKYSSTILLGSGVEGASVSQQKIPVELDVPAEK